MFDGFFTPPAILVQQALSSREEFVKAKGQILRASVAPNLGVIRWSKPPMSSIKFNWDASLDHSGKRMGVGIIARAGTGEFYAALVTTMPFIRDREVAEAMAAWRAFMFCEDLGVHKAVFEGDYLNVVNAINSHEECWRSCGNLVGGMQEKLMQHSEWLVNFTRREANLVAYCLAKHALEIHHEVVWKEVCPPFLKPLVHEELM